jgi:hypothetical protein
MSDPSSSTTVRHEVANAIVFFPTKDNTNSDGYCSSFEEACQLAADSLRPLHLLQDFTRLSDTIKLRGRQHLTIHGCSSRLVSPKHYPSCNNEKRIKISGRVHSLFLLNNHSRLTLTDIDLIHESPNDDEDCRNVGAAINLRYKGSASIHRCTVTSESGFCGWAVQKARMEFVDCTLLAPMRSALVCFGQAQLDATLCLVNKSGVHGICARGDCTIHLTQSKIIDCTVRGLYAYANAHVTLEDCTVSGTIRPDMAAIEVSAACDNKVGIVHETSITSSKASKSGKRNACDGGTGNTASSLILKNCCIVDNSSAGIRLRGNVHHNDLVTSWSSSGNIIERNKGGDFDCRPHDTDISESQKLHSENDKIQTGVVQPLRRDVSGSSFRKGDWWCPKCHPEQVVPGSRNVCLVCDSEKKIEYLLSNEEVMRLNQGAIEIPTAQNESTTSTLVLAVEVVGHNVVTWWFDADDGWILYDAPSSSKLEEAFQLLSVSSDSNTISPIVYLSEGRYHVNLLTMEQINTETFFPRYVRRTVQQNSLPTDASLLLS